MYLWSCLQGALHGKCVGCTSMLRMRKSARLETRSLLKPLTLKEVIALKLLSQLLLLQRHRVREARSCDGLLPRKQWRGPSGTSDRVERSNKRPVKGQSF